MLRAMNAAPVCFASLAYRYEEDLSSVNRPNALWPAETLNVCNMDKQMTLCDAPIQTKYVAVKKKEKKRSGCLMRAW